MEGNKKNDVAEEEKEVSKAALLLYSWKFLKLDTIEAQTLEKQKQETRRQNRNNHDQAMPSEINDGAPRLPPVPALNGLIGECSRPLEKQLSKSDVKDDQSRLSLNKDFVIKYFLPMLKDGENPAEGIRVSAYDIEGNEYEEMMFKLWGKKMYVLTRDWKKFCHHHNFVKQTDWVTVWMFRHKQTNKLCFAITSNRLPVLD